MFKDEMSFSKWHEDTNKCEECNKGGINDAIICIASLFLAD